MFPLLPFLYGSALWADASVLELTLDDARQLVILQNMEIASQRLGWDAAKALHRGERESLWEPTLVLSGERERNERENNSEQFVSQGVDDFSERNMVYRIAVEQPLITGGQVQLGYTLRDLNNNLREQRELEGPERDYEAFLGLVFTQPLLRNAGREIALSLVEMARTESEVAFQEWRRQMMQALGSAEAAYWELHITQERVALREASVGVAEKILEDNRARFEAGRGGEVEVQQAEAGLALRQTQLLEARQELLDASSRLKTFFSESLRDGGMQLRTVDRPTLELQEMDEDLLLATAYDKHPDMLLRKHRLEQERLRMRYAENQTLPDLSVSASYGYNGLGEDASDAYGKIQDRDFVSWSVGVQLRVPLGGGRRARNEFEAARNRMRQGEMVVRSTEIALSNALVTSAQRVRNSFAQAQNYQRVAELNRRLLETELTRLDAGQSDSRKVLDTEERLTEALEREAASLTRYMVALIELELSSGALLSRRDLDPMDSTDLEWVHVEAPSAAEVPASGPSSEPEMETAEPTPDRRPVQGRPVTR